jgi:predicted HD phosphohydrolase
MPEALGTTTISSLAEATQADVELICAYDRIWHNGLPTRVLAHLELLRGDYGGMSVDRLDHCLQTATRATRAGESDEFILCALLHDIGDTVASYNHADLAATIVQPFVEPELVWMVQHHAIFQSYYFFGHLGLDPNGRDQFASHAHFDVTAKFCDEYDQAAFDHRYATMPLAEFVPLVTELMRRPRADASDAVLSWSVAADSRKSH